MPGTIHVLPRLGRWAVVREGEEEPIAAGGKVVVQARGGDIRDIPKEDAMLRTAAEIPIPDPRPPGPEPGPPVPDPHPPDPAPQPDPPEPIPM